ncbi:MAG: hypothetical protein ILN61_00895 [Lachnospiraceae bacterium]|nr:hypothetical protein [Lachnospiraceae bacterium]
MIKETIKKVSEGSFSDTEVTLMSVCLILIGIVIGMIIAPKRFLTLGSFNGNQGSLSVPDDAQEIKKCIEKKNEE